MQEHQPDPRSLNFAGDIDELGCPLPMRVEILRARTEKWPLSERTPGDVAALLTRSRQMFIDGYYTYENFIDAGTRSLQAVEAALRVRFNVEGGATFASLIDRAKREGLVSDKAHEILHIGRRLRNEQVHATSLSVINPAIAARIIATSHVLVAELFEA
jgi:hypothetical protein